MLVFVHSCMHTVLIDMGMDVHESKHKEERFGRPREKEKGIRGLNQLGTVYV